MANSILKKLFYIFPNFCLGRGLIDISFNYQLHQLYQEKSAELIAQGLSPQEIDATINAIIGSDGDPADSILTSANAAPLSFEVVGVKIMRNAIQGIVFFGLVLLIEEKQKIREIVRSTVCGKR